MSWLERKDDWRDEIVPYSSNSLVIETPEGEDYGENKIQILSRPTDKSPTV